MKLTKIPKLKSGNDEKVAEKLDEVIRDADSGLRRIIIAGFFLERIAAELKHGEFKPWVKAHCAESSRSSIYGWKMLAKNIMDVVKLKSPALLDFSTPVHEMLALPAAEVPKEQKELRRKIDEIIEGKSARQLFAEFKQTEGPDADGFMKPKVGRKKGHGGASVAQRAAAKAAMEAGSIEAMELWVIDTAEIITENADDAHWGRIDDGKVKQLLEAFQLGSDYLKGLINRRKAVKESK